jgi:N-acyl-D-aspartate/D-glutamate deacylase
MAAKRRVSPLQVLCDLAVESRLNQVFGHASSPEMEEQLLVAMRHPRTIMTFSDSGAHVRQISGGDLQTTLLSRWVRERGAFSLEEAVRMITLAPALAWKLPERGLLREGLVADVNVIDPLTIAPAVPTIEQDLPSGAQRIKQKAVGILATIVAGEEVFHAGEHTGALPGQLLRGRLARRHDGPAPRG